MSSNSSTDLGAPETSTGYYPPDNSTNSTNSSTTVGMAMGGYIYEDEVYNGFYQSPYMHQFKASSTAFLAVILVLFVGYNVAKALYNRAIDVKIQYLNSFICFCFIYRNKRNLNSYLKTLSEW